MSMRRLNFIWILLGSLSMAGAVLADGVLPIVAPAGVVYGSAQHTLTSSPTVVNIDTTTYRLNALRGVKTSTITFADGTILASSSTLGAASVTWGNITGTLANQADLQTSLLSIGSSTTSLKTSVTALGASTGTLQSSVVNLGASTGTLLTSIQATGASTGTLAVSVTNLGASTGTLATSVTSLGASTGTLAANVGASTATLQTSVQNLGASTGTIQTQLNGALPVSLSSGIVGSLSGSSIVLISSGIPFGSATNALKVDTNTFTWDNVNKTLTVSQSSDAIHYQSLTVVATGYVDGVFQALHERGYLYYVPSFNPTGAADASLNLYASTIPWNSNLIGGAASVSGDVSVRLTAGASPAFNILFGSATGNNFQMTPTATTIANAVIFSTLSASQFVRTDGSTRLSSYDLLNSTQSWTGRQTFLSSATFSGNVGLAGGVNVSSGILLAGSAGINGQVLTSAGPASTPTWTSATNPVLASSGIAFGSATNTVITDTNSLTWNNATKTLSIAGAGGLSATYGVSATTANFSALSGSQFVKTDGSKNLSSYDLFNSSNTFAGTQTYTSSATYTSPNGVGVTYGITAGSITAAQNVTANSMVTAGINITGLNTHQFAVTGVTTNLQSYDLLNATQSWTGGNTFSSITISTITVSSASVNGPLNLTTLQFADGSTQTSAGGAAKALTLFGSVTQSNMHKAGFVVVHQHYAYVVSNKALSVFDVAVPSSPVLLTQFSSGPLINGAEGIEIKDNYLYTAAFSSNALIAIDISQPANPVIVGMVQSISLLNEAEQVRIVGNYAYVGAFDSGLTAVDISTPSAMRIVGSVPIADALSVQIKYPYAYVTEDADFGSPGTCQADILDVSNPTNMVLISTYQAVCAGSGGFTGSDFYGRYMYMGESSGRIFTIDISSPFAPVFVSSVSTGSDSPLTVRAIEGDLYFSAVNTNSIVRYSLANPLLPVFSQRLTDNASLIAPDDLYFAEGYLWVSLNGAGATGGLASINMGLFSAPAMITGSLLSDELEVTHDARMNRLMVGTGITAPFIGAGNTLQGGTVIASSIAYVAGSTFTSSGNLALGKITWANGITQTTYAPGIVSPGSTTWANTLGMLVSTLSVTSLSSQQIPYIGTSGNQLLGTANLTWDNVSQTLNVGGTENTSNGLNINGTGGTFLAAFNNSGGSNALLGYFSNGSLIGSSGILSTGSPDSGPMARWRVNTSNDGMTLDDNGNLKVLSAIAAGAYTTLGSSTTAGLAGTTPSAVNQAWYCSNCVNALVCISTAIAKGAFASEQATNRTTACN